MTARTFTPALTRAELIAHFLPSARAVVAEHVASGAWASWANNPDKLEFAALELARCDAQAAIQRGDVRHELKLQGSERAAA